jgi:hypothetical protein
LHQGVLGRANGQGRFLGGFRSDGRLATGRCAAKTSLKGRGRCAGRQALSHLGAPIADSESPALAVRNGTLMAQAWLMSGPWRRGRYLNPEPVLTSHAEEFRIELSRWVRLAPVGQWAHLYDERLIRDDHGGLAQTAKDPGIHYPSKWSSSGLAVLVHTNSQDRFARALYLRQV